MEPGCILMSNCTSSLCFHAFIITAATITASWFCKESSPHDMRSLCRVTQGKLHVDVGMWGGLTPQNSGDPEQLQGLLDAGALGLKAFLSPSGALQLRTCA